MITTLQRRVPLIWAWIVSQAYKISICSPSITYSGRDHWVIFANQIFVESAPRTWPVSQAYKISICSPSIRYLATFSNIWQYLVIFGKKNCAECPSHERGQYLDPTKYPFANRQTNIQVGYIWQYLPIRYYDIYIFAESAHQIFEESAPCLSLASISSLQNIYLLAVNHIFGNI